MALTPALDIARSALLAQESALAVVGHNIANVNTPGYTREVPDLEATQGQPAAAGVVIGGGVRLRGVIQVIDPLLARRQLGAETDRGEQSMRRDQLTVLSETLNDLTEPSLASAVDSFFDAADALVRNPGGVAERQTLLGRATGLAAELNQRSAAVASLQRAADSKIGFIADSVNEDLTKIAAFSRDIQKSEVVGQPANDLRDERQLVLNDLASKLAITTMTDEQGAVTVSSVAGPVLVANGEVIHGVAVRAAGPGLDGSVLHDLGLTDTAGGFFTVPTVFAHGELGALTSVRDGTLVTASANLDTVAGALRDAVNAIQTDAAARDLNGNPTTATPLFSGTGAGDLTVAITDPRQIAAALSAEPGDNQNALRLADLRTAAPVSVAPASVPSLAIGNQPLSQYLAGEIGRLGGETATASEAATASELVAKQLETQRATLSGVNLNEELASLIKYQRAFQAAAQLLNVTNSTFDDLMRVA
jgi:flagellar hook-associated protein 1 FlgK